ncbi:MAG: hypothetical protein LBF15_03530 [Candidatus Peribacteria bacterium]|nr:hypothetical protein [Candidatus Peribacteria bacterium]
MATKAAQLNIDDAHAVRAKLATIIAISCVIFAFSSVRLDHDSNHFILPYSSHNTDKFSLQLVFIYSSIHSIKAISFENSSI